jgi:hypothetical protein
VAPGPNHWGALALLACACSRTDLGADPPLAEGAFVYVHGVELARFDGPGRLSRLWMTMTSLDDGRGTPSILRIYVDDDPNPAVEGPLSTMLDGSAGPMFAPPFGAGSSHYLAWYYPLAFRRRLVVAMDYLANENRHYYQVDAVLGEPGTDVTRGGASLDRARATLDAVSGGPVSAPHVFHDGTPFTLHPGEEAILVDTPGPGMLEDLRLGIARPELKPGGASSRRQARAGGRALAAGTCSATRSISRACST